MTGWMRPRRLASPGYSCIAAMIAQRIVRASVLLCLAANVQAGEQNAQPKQVDEDLLLFLADWEDEHGNWQDPLEYEQSEQTGQDRNRVSDDEQANTD